MVVNSFHLRVSCVLSMPAAGLLPRTGYPFTGHPDAVHPERNSTMHKTTTAVAKMHIGSVAWSFSLRNIISPLEIAAAPAGLLKNNYVIQSREVFNVNCRAFADLSARREKILRPLFVQVFGIYGQPLSDHAAIRQCCRENAVLYEICHSNPLEIAAAPADSGRLCTSRGDLDIASYPRK